MKESSSTTTATAAKARGSSPAPMTACSASTRCHSTSAVRWRRASSASRPSGCPPAGFAQRMSGTGRAHRVLRLDAPELYYPGPLCGFVGEELAEIRGRAREHHPAHVGEPLHDLGIGEACVGFLVEMIHDRGGRILRRGDAEP